MQRPSSAKYFLFIHRIQLSYNHHGNNDANHGNTNGDNNDSINIDGDIDIDNDGYSDGDGDGNGDGDSGCDYNDNDDAIVTDAGMAVNVSVDRGNDDIDNGHRRPSGRMDCT